MRWRNCRLFASLTGMSMKQSAKQIVGMRIAVELRERSVAIRIITHNDE